MRSLFSLSVVVALLSGCGGEPPEELVQSAKAKVERAAAVGHLTRGALEVLGLMPVYTCGEPRRGFLDYATVDLSQRLACATTTVESLDAVTDGVVVTFSGPDCQVHGLGLSGRVFFRYRGGEDRMEVEADLRQLRVEGVVLPAEVGYGTCGDLTSVWVKAEGDLPGREGHTLRMDAKVTKRPGMPLLGGSSLLLDGTGELRGPDGVDKLTLTTLQYEVGEYLPKEGRAILETADGHHVEASFKPVLWRVGKVELTVDDYSPVTVPIVR
ncbi:hypothetical protein [Myxococcus fulvus]|uniref:hypothetical protein n=1 Tax=Myxococcus fulvus TaxID=33 RepID=UPI0020BDF551|nr:hypothetical protein [Myxococcus fulvus]MCK8502386.1 hypothetical protein [Myxococcus fulvus]